MSTADVLGVDVSSWQKPDAINYERLAETHRYLVARVCYGTRLDVHFQEHVRRAQDAGISVGGYLFYRPHQTVASQLAAFGDAVAKAGMGPGWLPPALDVESNKFNGAFTPERYEPQCHEIATAWEDQWGTALLYTNPNDWRELGSPTWIEGFLLWLAHYAKRPAPPLGMAVTIWQHTGTGRLEGVYDGPLDLNVADTLPILGTPRKS